MKTKTVVLKEEGEVKGRRLERRAKDKEHMENYLPLGIRI
jgi:hypothetical protein